MKIYTLLHGIYPRSEKLVAATRAYDRKRIGKQYLQEIIKQDYDHLQRLVASLEIDFPNDGMLQHQDLFRPLLESTENIKIGALTRFFNTNTFYRQPVIGKNPVFRLKKRQISQYYSFPKQNNTYTMTFPSPLTLLGLSKITSGQTEKTTIEQFTSFIANTTNLLTKRGGGPVVFHEPYLVYGQKSEKLTQISVKRRLYVNESFDLLRQSLDTPLALITYFGNLAQVLDWVTNLPVDIIGFDCYKTYLEQFKIKTLGQKGVFLGVIDAENSLVEDSEQIIKFVQKIIKLFKPESIYLGSNCSFEYVPQAIAEKKLVVLAKTAKKLKRIYA